MHSQNSRQDSANLSILFLGKKWKYDSFGIAALNESLMNDIWTIDPEASRINMKCVVFDEITDTNVKDASLSGVELIGAKLLRGEKTFPDMSTCDMYCLSYLQNIDFKTENFTYIVGHVPYLANAPIYIRDHVKSSYNDLFPKIILVVHDLPRQGDDINEEDIIFLIREAHLILSVGHTNFNLIEEYRNQADSDVIHKLYLPYCPPELFNKARPKCEANEIKNDQKLLTFVRGPNHEHWGTEFKMVATASASAVNDILAEMRCHGTQFQLG